MTSEAKRNNNDMSANITDFQGGVVEAGRTVSDTEKNLSTTDVPLDKKTSLGNNDGHAFNIDKWVGYIERILDDVPQYMCKPGHPGRISKIPENLREADVKGYEPYYMSIGPYHHDKACLQQTEQRKHLFLKLILETKPEITLEDYLKEVKSIEKQARGFYSEVNMESEEFVRMLLLDSLFILTLFCGMPRSLDDKDRAESENQINEDMEICDDLANTQKWFWYLFVHDIFLLENQLPFFVLQKVYDLAYCSSKTTQSFVERLNEEFIMWLHNT